MAPSPLRPNGERLTKWYVAVWTAVTSLVARNGAERR